MAISNIASNLRPGVVTSTTRPTSPYHGQVIFETDTNRTLVWDNSAWVMVTDTDQPPGLQLVANATWSTGSSLSVDNCFTTDYDSYRLVVTDAKHATTSVNCLFRLRRNGVDKGTNGYYWSRRFIGFSGSPTAGDTGASNSADIVPGIVASTSNAGSGIIDLHNPKQSMITACTFQSIWAITTGETGVGSGFLNDTLDYDGFSLIANTGNFTSLRVRVYGYRN